VTFPCAVKICGRGNAPNEKIGLSLFLIKQRDMKAYGGVEVCLHAFVTLTLERGGQIASRHGDFILSESSQFIHQAEN
jgi:hypothetical protein